MPLIIDGHNLIPKIPGLSLDQVDDEVQLIQLLQEFSRLSRVGVECYFDKAPQGYDRPRRYGMVAVKFSRLGRSADDEIRSRLMRLGGDARNYTVVSSDFQLQAAARAAKARVMTADSFAQKLQQTLRKKPETKGTPEKELSPEEIEEWLKIFRSE